MFVDEVFPDTAGALVSMVVKNRLALPAAGNWAGKEGNDGNFVFSERQNLRGYASVLVLPLLVQEQVLGTFTIASRRPKAFPQDRREMLGVIANQVAISIQNGRMYQELEQKATTDGLTGLLNHRTFQERLTALLGRAERLKFPIAIVLTDVDHFKKVNDTYGHPNGGRGPAWGVTYCRRMRAEDRYCGPLRRRRVCGRPGVDR